RHDGAPHDVVEAAWFLRACERWWGEGTLFVCVVDPGVGTSRRIIAAESNGRIFLAPDNGLLTFVDAQTIVSVENESLFLPNGSTTFHGRDRFAPVAAAIANDMPITELGPKIDDVIKIDYTPPVYGRDAVSGTIVAVDRSGNAVTAVERARIPFEPFTLRTHYTHIARVATTYEGSEPFLIVGSGGTLEISIGNASAADVLH